MPIDENGIEHQTNVDWCGENVVTKKNYSIINVYGTGINVELPFNCSDRTGTWCNGTAYKEYFLFPGVNRLHDKDLQGGIQGNVARVMDFYKTDVVSFSYVTVSSGTAITCNNLNYNPKTYYYGKLYVNVNYYESAEMKNDIVNFQIKMRLWLFQLVKSSMIIAGGSSDKYTSPDNINYFDPDGEQFDSKTYINNMINSVSSDFDSIIGDKYKYKYQDFLNDRQTNCITIVTNNWNNNLILILATIYGNYDPKGGRGYNRGQNTMLIPQANGGVEGVYYGTGQTFTYSSEIYNVLATILLLCGALQQQIMKSFDNYIPDYRQFSTPTITASEFKQTSIKINIYDQANQCFDYSYYGAGNDDFDYKRFTNNNYTIQLNNLLPGTRYNFDVVRRTVVGQTMRNIDNERVDYDTTRFSFTTISTPVINKILVTSNNFIFYIPEENPDTYIYTYNISGVNYNSGDISTQPNTNIQIKDLSPNINYVLSLSRYLFSSNTLSEVTTLNFTTLSLHDLSNVLVASQRAIFSITDQPATIFSGTNFTVSYNYVFSDISKSILLSTPFNIPDSSGSSLDENRLYNLQILRVISGQSIVATDTISTTFTTLQLPQLSKLLVTSNNAVYSFTDSSATNLLTNFSLSYSYSLYIQSVNLPISTQIVSLNTPFLISQLTHLSAYAISLFRTITRDTINVTDIKTVLFTTAGRPTFINLLTSSNNARFSYEDTTISNPLSYPISYSYLTTVGATILTTPQIITQNPFFVNGFLPDVSNSIQFRRTAIVSGISVIDNYVSYNITPIALPVVNIILTSTTIMFYVIIDISLSTLATYSYSYDISNSITSKINQPIPSPFTIPLFVKDLTQSTPYAFNVNRNIQYSGINQTIVDTLPLTFTTAEKLICFKEDSKILTIQGYIPIQELRPGDLVKTYRNNYVSIDMIGKRSIYHPCDTKRIKDQLYKCSRKTYPEIFEDLVITGCHSILVNDFKNSQEKENTKEVNGFLYVTDEKYRLPACCDERASVYEMPGTYTIYHLALENEDYCGNYGIYANGLLVETCSQRYLKELANMELIE
jgi:hypothetical protein